MRLGRGVTGCVTAIVGLDAGEKRIGEACSLSITVSASVKKDDASEMNDEMEEKREADLFGESLIFVFHIVRCFKQRRISSHYGAGRQYLYQF